MVPLRATYFLTVPFIVAAGIALLRFREPQLHRAEEAEPLRQQIAATYRALLERGAVRPIVALLVLTALLLQAVLEFGPLWLALGLGGLLGGRLVLSRPVTAAVIAATIVGCCVVLTTSHVIGIVVLAQVLLVLVVINLVGGFEALGTLLSVGLMILPAASARFWARDLGPLIAAATLFALGAAVAGLVLSYHAALPTGPAIILAAGAGWLFSLLFGSAGGLLHRLWPASHLEA